eukprot:CAMPEP_0194130042 /NCGR_PEP_ID=MMETSP0152-20130528/1202_1 /TAXON_ID=1049557 /ORGANISM="Thalassiothrix antarctica, Strain L6-D1" /LENGTH=104 /DNA_ID=CAMNT_0038824459 /DNA_START=98 /DNA_END=409 /DNA_ORIENTATION=-
MSGLGALAGKFPSPITAVNLKIHDGSIIGNKKSFQGTHINVGYKQEPIVIKDGDKDDKAGMKQFVSALNMERVVGNGVLYLVGNNVLTRKLGQNESVRIFPDAW